MNKNVKVIGRVTETVPQVLELITGGSCKTISLLTCNSTIYPVKLRSDTLRLFKYKGIECYICGTVGDHFVLKYDRSADSYFVELYAKCPMTLAFTIMTRDHLYPKSKGGKNSLENAVTMCRWCNLVKSNEIYRRLDEGWYDDNGCSSV